MTTTAATTTYSPDDLAPRLDAVETAVQELRAEQRQTNARLDALTERTAAIEGRLTGIETNLSDLRSELRSDIGLLHTRLDAMQQTLGARIDNMQQTMDARLDTIQQTLGARIDNMQQTMGAMQQTTDTRLDNMQQETNGRIERVFWAIVGAGVAFVVVGGGIIGALLAVAI